MSTEARRAPVPPRPAGPPPPSGPPLARPAADPADPGEAPRPESAADGSRNPGPASNGSTPGTNAGRRPAPQPGAAPTGISGRTSGGKPGIPPRPVGPPPQRPPAQRAPAARRTAPRSTVPPDEDTARLRPVPPAPPAGAVPPRPTRPPATPPPSAPASASTGTSTPLPPPPPAYKVARETPQLPDGPPARTQRRPVGSVDLTRPPGSGRPTLPPPPYRWPVEPPLTPAETTTRLRPVPARHPGRTAAAIGCVVLGLGLIGGAVTGTWLTGDSSADPASGAGYAPLRTLWHSTPVDTFFPPTLKGDGAGPGGADRTWTRVAVAPDSGCAGALDPLLLKTLRTVGCERVLRATYTDATNTSVITVGMVFTEAEPAAMKALGARFTDEKLTERTDLMPRTFPVKGTVAADFGDGQRASWTVNVLTEAPVVVYAVSGFADGRRVPDPQPVDKATADGAKTAAAQSGLGHEAKGVADQVERGLRTAVSTATEPPG
ncbi:hypothetical protein ACFT9I_21495 [Streptomyces sp. NPDC057137]|uniref:hypothetical protein n=1 Tax=Streptomyces sp. NPDC057137 TaxID=3346030 RepID=UPI003635B068